MSDQGQSFREGSSDWESYSSSSLCSAASTGHRIDSSTGLLTTLMGTRRNLRLTSFSLFRQRFQLHPSTRNGRGGQTGSQLPKGIEPVPSDLPRVPADVATTFSPPLAAGPGLLQRLNGIHRSQLGSPDKRCTSAPQRSDRHARNCASSQSNRPPILSTQHGNTDIPLRISLLPCPSLTCTSLVPPAHAWSGLTRMDPNNPTQSPNLADLLTSLSSQEDGSRKMAAFKLQSLINDPSFAEHFVIAGGLPRLRTLILESSGNTLAYSLASFARLLEVDQGWEAVNDSVVEKARAPTHSLKHEPKLTGLSASRLWNWSCADLWSTSSEGQWPS